MGVANTDTYLDSFFSRTAGEAWTINNGATLTVRTDTRVHVVAPSGNTGSLGPVTVNEGSFIWDSASVRVVPFNTGSGNVPAIGTTVTQGGVSGYLLGVWPNWASAQTSVGAAMPTTGFIKFREVTGGTFAVGALTGIGAVATDISVQGWIEIVMDSNSTITLPRIGNHTIRGDRFYIGVTDGTIGQQFQVPSMGSTVQVCPGAFIERSPGSDNEDDDYEIWPGIVGWSHVDVGGPLGGTDCRQNFLKALPGGKLQIGEAWSVAATYASVAEQASTYTQISYPANYTWLNDTLTVYYSAGHGVMDSSQVGLQFTTGGAVGSSGVFVATVLSPYHLSVPLAGSGASGSVTIRQTISLVYIAHTVGVNDEVYCDFTSGEGVDGYFECSYSTENSYRLLYPLAYAIIAGNVSVRHSLSISLSVNHLMSVGQQVYLDFTSGGGVSGIYTIRTVPSSVTFTVLYPHSATISGSVTIKRTIGNIPPAGCRMWIPSTILTECSSTSRNINIAANAVLATRPEWVTTAAGQLDFDYLYASSGFFNFTNAYEVKLIRTLFFDQIKISNPASVFDIDLTAAGSTGDTNLYNYCFYAEAVKSAGVVSRSKFLHGRIGASYNYALYLISSANVEFYDTLFVNYKYTGRTTISGNITGCENIIGNGLHFMNGCLRPSNNNKLELVDMDYTDRINGKTNAINSFYAVDPNGINTDVTIDGLTFGFGGEILDVHAISGAFNITDLVNSKIKNVINLEMGSFIPNLYGASYGVRSDGNAKNIKFSRCYFKNPRTGLIYTSSSDSDIQFDNIRSDGNPTVRTWGGFNYKFNSVSGSEQTSGQTAVYGKVFGSFFIGVGYGRLALTFNDPSEESTSQFSVVAGTPKFNGAGGFLSRAVGDKAIFRDVIFRLGYTAFEDIAPTMTGGTIGNYALQYRIDTGSGFSTWKDMTGANLSGEVITPTTGFKMEWSIETITANTSAITYLSISLLTTSEAQQALYPLDQVSLTIPGLISGSDVIIYEAGTYNILASVDAYSGTSLNYVYETPQKVDISIIKSGYYIKRILNFQLPDTDSSIPDVGQTATTCNV